MKIEKTMRGEKNVFEEKINRQNQRFWSEEGNWSKWKCFVLNFWLKNFFLS